MSAALAYPVRPFTGIITLAHAVQVWDAQRWPNFRPQELACTCSACGGQIYWDEAFFDALQHVRNEVGPLIINSAHRCRLKNTRVGGAVRSQHLKMAADISLRGHDRHALYKACVSAGFTGFGFYQTFLHVDRGRKRQWFGSQWSRKLWA